MPALQIEKSGMKSLRLSTKISLVLSAMVCTVYVMQAFWSINQEHRDRRDALLLRAKLISEMQSDALSGPLWDYDQERALSSLNGILKDPDILQATVYDDANEVFAQISGRNFDSSAKLDLKTLTLVEKINFSPTNSRRKLVGKIKILMSLDRIEKALTSDIINSSIFALLIMVVMILGLTLAIRNITRPLVNMTEIMRRREGNDFSMNIKNEYLLREDEIGDIARSLEQDQRNRRDEEKILETTRAIATELKLDVLLKNIMEASSELLDAERSTLFLFDEKKNLLWSRFAQGLEQELIELKPGEGIAGTVWKNGKFEIIEDPYNDARFNPDIDLKTGFKTRNILCIPIRNKEGITIGVAQALNKRDGKFTDRDVKRLTSLNAQVSAALENAQLFENVLSMRNYNESILKSLTNGVISLDHDRRVQKINKAAENIIEKLNTDIEGNSIETILGVKNTWLYDAIEQVDKTGSEKQVSDIDLHSINSKKLAVNMSIAPLKNLEEQSSGFLAVIEDISQEKRVRNTMARYMPGSVVEQLLEQAEENLGGSLQPVTILFSDIRGFTTRSEEIGARATVSMLNEYLSLMVDIIEEHDGILDKFIGDAIMGLFGAPFPRSDDAINSVKTAQGMLKSLGKLNSIRIKRGEFPIEIGIGINTGEVVVGNIGSAKRMDYTVIGDAVNLAARLESATKHYSSNLLISETTYERITEDMQKCFRKVDIVTAKGKTLPVSIYEGLGDNHPLLSKLESWDEAIESYRNQEWVHAKERFTEFLENTRFGNNIDGSGNVEQSDPVARIYIERISFYEQNPPGTDWNGVYTMKTK